MLRATTFAIWPPLAWMSIDTPCSDVMMMSQQKAVIPRTQDS